MTADEPGLASAQIEWADGAWRVRALRRGLDERGAAAFDRAEAALAAGLVKRLGPSYRLRDLYAAYVDSDRWARDVVLDAMAPQRFPAALSPLVDAAFARAAAAARDA